MSLTSALVGHLWSSGRGRNDSGLLTDSETPACRVGCQSKRCVLAYRLHHERKGRTSRLILMRGRTPLAASQPVTTDYLVEWMQRYEVPFTGLVRTGWMPTEDQWVAILRKWFPDFSPPPSERQTCPSQEDTQHQSCLDPTVWQVPHALDRETLGPDCAARRPGNHLRGRRDSS
jgi:hypothetical protein